MPRRDGRISKQVEGILKYSREARNSDKELEIRMMQEYGMCLTESQKETFRTMPSMETIRRIRQKFQSGGQYLPDQVIAEDRHFRGLRMQQMNLDAHNVEKLTEAPKAVSWLNDD